MLNEIFIMNILYTCPICGYDKLNEPPFDQNGEGSFEICPSCNNEFGYNLFKSDKDKIKVLRLIYIKKMTIRSTNKLIEDVE